MENAADALKMAAAVLIFVLALSISINAFSEARQATDIILQYNDREYEYTYVEENKDDSGKVLTERLVGIESIIPSIYKAYKENYKIVFDVPDPLTTNSKISLYKKRNAKTGIFEDKNYIDLQREALAGGEEQKRIFIHAILYGKNYENYQKDGTKKEWNDICKEFETLGIKFTNTEGLYNVIGSEKYKEALGVYYQEEVDGNDSTEDSEMPNASKTKKRIITYSEI